MAENQELTHHTLREIFRHLGSYCETHWVNKMRMRSQIIIYLVAKFLMNVLPESFTLLS